MRVSCKITVVITMMVVALALSVRISSADDIDELAKALRNSDLRVSLVALEKMGKVRDERVVDALMEFVSAREEDWRIKIKGIRLLGEMADPRSSEVLIKLLTDVFVNENCPSMKWHTVLALGNFKNTPRVIEALIGSLKSDDILLREAAIQSLGNIGDPVAVEHIIPALDERSFAIRLSAIKALGQIGDASAIPHLERVAEKEKDPYIKETAVQALKGKRPAAKAGK